jgi:deoxyadenosine/deoxycytidine kinase
MKKNFVLVAGNIGAGKTTLTDRLALRLGWYGGYETVATNPFLADFYRDMKTWAFHLQIYFLGDRAEQHTRLAEMAQSTIIDRSIYEDAHIFARALVALGNMTEREYDAYRRVYDQVIVGLPVPDLLLYLDASPRTCSDRIRARGREIESGITLDYLSLLDDLYREWIAGFDICPVLTVPAESLDFVANEAHIDIILERIEQKLAGQEQVVFPAQL